jgi:hypothetical protein
MPDFQSVIAVLSLIGLGGIVGSFITFRLNKSKELEFKVREQKEKRYKSCLLYMDAFFKPENIKYLSSRQPDIDSEKDVLEYLRMEYHEMVVYASAEVIGSVKEFIDNPTRERFLNAILMMRKDLWNKNDLEISELLLNEKQIGA